MTRLLSLLLLLAFCGPALADRLPRNFKVLILDGQNNHDWRSTTPMIRAVLLKPGGMKWFEVDVLTAPPGDAPPEAWEKFKPDYAKYHVIVSNFSDFGAKPAPPAFYDAIADYVAKGGGLVLVHAATSVQNQRFMKLAGLGWSMDNQGVRVHVDDAGKTVRTEPGQGTPTGHGGPFRWQITAAAPDHPVLSGMPKVFLHETDELWYAARGPAENLTVLATAVAPESKLNEPVMWTITHGKGRVFVTLLGHDATAMTCVGFATTLSRGCEWAATGEVKQDLPTDLPKADSTSIWDPPNDLMHPPRVADPLRVAEQPDGGFALLLRDKPLWHLHASKGPTKPYIHPLRSFDGDDLTWHRPADHVWHYGLWFSWKLINGVNYWEEDPKTLQSAGITEVERSQFAGDKAGALTTLELSYHEPGKPAVLKETRGLRMHPPLRDGSYRIDWTLEFTAQDQEVTLDRTRPKSQGGPAWGGYAGLSYRAAETLQKHRVLDSDGFTTDQKLIGSGRPARWMDFSGIDAKSGRAHGVTIFDHPKNPRHPSPFYVFLDGKFGYIGPALLFNEPLKLKPRETLTLRYRVLVHPGRGDAVKLKTEYGRWIQ